MKTSYLFIALTLLCILGHLYFTQSLPFGVWQIVVASIGLVIVKKFNLRETIPTLLICIGLIRLAYWEPIIFIGGSLILHNWIGFFYWIKASENKKRKSVALFCLLIFSLIHLLVFNGTFDAYFPLEQTKDSITTGWYLASWSRDPVVWYRMLVLYAFGLSMHYFVWLKAIPESLNPIEHPNNVRLTLKYLREDLGRGFLILLLLISAIGLSLWLFSFGLGSRIYFECAILHGTLEIVFLIPRFFYFKFFPSFLSKRHHS